MEIIVLKVGGSILEKLPTAFFDTVIQLKKSGKIHPVIVHGGGPEINQALTKMNVKSEFVNGLRVTTKEVLEVVENILNGSVNKQIVTKLQQSGGTGIGLSGVDAALLKVTPQDSSGKLGYVGEVKEVNADWLKLIIENGGIPVVSPIGIHESGQHYNINGDTAAAAVAESLRAKLALISDIPGVLEEIEGEKVLLPKLTKKEIEAKISSGIIYGGMIPKVYSALKALSGGVKESVILNGLTPEDLQSYIAGKRVGTKIVIGEVQHV
ncbi:acetylglutamate kinase [Oceanobacillus alkalisoli]|uniref:acetylglutamate kinase n=1 Tax=Oceanobacillus alkalisoli TaxID=2925113 RepID=UPI001EF0F4A1|nr:acetylglutamate kinase [Oceanobacillus alkalisoli]MCF3941990.1 acetylglutamate kinase [Oceanobacillus alkalisoli]MCG5102057.1 acetylglutamate kinase [Oceanobacillus alkalisoli]